VATDLGLAINRFGWSHLPLITRAAIRGTIIMTHTLSSQEMSLGAVVESLQHQFSDHGDKLRVGSNRSGTYQLDSKFLTFPLELSIKVKNNLHVIGNESNRRDDNPLDAICSQLLHSFFNPGFQPGLGGWTAPALINQFPGFATCGVS
jgi:hypothetical protein